MQINVDGMMRREKSRRRRMDCIKSDMKTVFVCIDIMRIGVLNGM